MALRPLPGGGSKEVKRAVAPAPKLRPLPGGKAVKAVASGDHAARVDNSPLGILRQAGTVVGGVAKGLGGLVQEAARANVRPTTRAGTQAQLDVPEAERLPILTETLIRSPIKTAKSLVTPVQLAKGTPWSETELGKRVNEEGAVGAGLSTLSDLAVFAGGIGAVGKAAGAGRLAQAARLEELAGASAKAAGLGRKATLAEIESAAKAAETAGDAQRAAGLSHAAGQARLAETLRTMRPATVGERVTAGAETAKSLGSHVAAAPAKPYTFAARQAGKLAGKAVERSPRAAAIAEQAAAAVERFKTKKRFRDTYHEEVTAPLAEAMYEMVEGRHSLGDSMRKLSVDEQAAVTLRRGQVGTDPAFRRLYAELDAGDKRALIEAAIPGADAVKAYQIMNEWETGRLDPEVAARMDDTAAKLGEFYAERERDVYLTGEGASTPLAERGLEARRQRAEGRPADMDVESVYERTSAGTKRRLARTEAEAAELRMAVGDPAVTAPRTPHQERQTGTFAERVRAAQDGAPKARAQGAAADLAARQETFNARRSQSAQEHRLKTLAARRERDLAKLDELHKRAERDIDAAPPQDRPALRANEAAARFAKSLAEKEPEHAHFFLELADELAVTTQDLRAKGIVPEFSFGGKDVDVKAPVTSTGGPAIRGKKKLASERHRSEGRLKLTLAKQAETAADEVRGVVRNRFAAKVQDGFGSTAKKSIDTKKLTGAELADALEAADLRAWDPRTGKQLKPEDVTPDSAVLPRVLFDHFDGYMKKANENSLKFKTLRVYDKATGAWKTTVLAYSPRWQVGNLIGNTTLAVVGAGVNPARLPGLWAEARRLVKSGEAPTEIIARGFHAGELADLSAKSTRRLPTIKGRGVAEWSYRANSYVDNVNRTAIYLAEKGKGVSNEAAVKSALRAAGDFSRMSPVERNGIRRAAPFWAWQKHITTLAFRLPLENPARVAWTLHLADVADRAVDDPGAGNPFNEGSIPLPGGKRLNLRSADPFGSSLLVSGATDLDSINRSLGYSLNPILKTGAAALSGMNANRGGGPVRTPEADFGAPAEPLFGVRHPRRLAELAAQSVPQVRQLQDAAAGTAPLRVDTGQPIPGRSTDRGRLAQLARVLGVPFPEPEQKPSKAYLKKKRDKKD